MGMTRPAETSMYRYPASGHILRWVRLAFDGRGHEGTVEGLMPALPDLCDEGGAVRLGALALLVDYGAGMSALHSVQPDWTVTHDLAIHLSGLAPAEGELESTCRVVRAGRNNIMSETTVVTADGREIARAYVTFTRLKSREGTPTATSDQVINLAEAPPAERPRGPIDEVVGFRFSPDPAGPHWVEFDHSPFTYNSLKAIQGGVIALSLERAASWAAQQLLGRPCRTTDLHLHYLALGKTGPFRAKAEVVRGEDEEVVSRVSLHDTGDDDRLLALGVGTAEPI